ncbi:hypothetical protein ZWY2020_049109 [Hordeum vulgare]|nr:hypothetical protein ZWY2020_049109 [Hordeum vulgare]
MVARYGSVVSRALAPPARLFTRVQGIIYPGRWGGGRRRISRGKRVNCVRAERKMPSMRVVEDSILIQEAVLRRSNGSRRATV